MQPNIIIFLVDDMGTGDTRAYQDWTGNQDDEQLHTLSLKRLARLGRALYRCTHPINRMYPHALCPAHRTLLLAHTTQTQSRLWSPLSATHRKRTAYIGHHPQKSRISHRHLGKMACGPHLHKIRWLTRRGMGRRRRAPTPHRLPRRTRL